MAGAVRQLKLDDFSGGLNLRRSEFTLGQAESPDMMNVEYAEGGIRTRRGWERWNTSPISGGAWNPRTAYIHERASGLDSLLVANAGDSTLYWSSAGTFQALQAGGSDATTAAGLHEADYAPWGDLVYVARGNRDMLRWGGVSASADEMSPVPNSTAWAPDYTVPGTGSAAPRSDYVAAHGGRLWIASTHENGSAYPHRLRWSHPNNPEAWADHDFLDILVGGGPITGIVPMSDHLLVFKASSIFAIYGYDGESQQLINVSWTKGARNRQLIARSETACYFMSFPDGVFQISNSQSPVEVSEDLRPMLASNDYNKAEGDQQWLGWIGNRLWWSVPYQPDGADAATDATVCFVMDPSVANGSWTRFQTGTGFGLGPFAQGAYAQGSVDQFGFARDSPDVMRVDINSDPVDDLGGVPTPFPTRYTTRWMDAGYTDLKKRWKRPTFVALDAGEEYRFQVSVRANFQKKITRRFGVNISTASVGARYGDGSLYGDDVYYASEHDEQMELRKGSSLGTAAAVQLQLDGQPGIPWGFGSIVFKYRSRRLT